jgi:hypothetical protein
MLTQVSLTSESLALIKRKPLCTERLLSYRTSLRILISGFTLALSDGNHKNHHFLIEDLIDQSIAGAAQFECVTVR